ncbi:DUF1573 domain-containing protein [Flavobacterium sp. NRK F10]|uniref:DUF1573 domain-containing protein n=1 Tax=Flavobacterium sediminis TaxID=2201181 RepID=A0A2U8QX45_9FLAO|nr:MULTISPECIES: DUF1573 domain-containing protein [Flavobacterium]AWM14777.1 hypothetical protein DI487_13560 [Flavobacterium sediminis]MCO6176022.1 DUF1573 domain-containing protein [Flavobacterium sp. NRK F10]
MKKMIYLAAVAITLITVSCKDNVQGKITDEDMATVEAEKAMIGKLPKVSFDKTEYDFGTINSGDVVETEFIVTNTGESDLVISDAKASCGCTVPVYPKQPVKPGESAPIKVSFNSSGKSGMQNKTVTLTTNTENGKETFAIKANVLTK